MASEDIQIVKLPLEESSRGRWRRVAVVVGFTVLVSTPGFVVIARDQQAKAEAAVSFWRLKGPACAPLSAARFRDVQRAPSATVYDGVLYERHGGTMMCTHRTEAVAGAPVRRPVCRFNSPDYLGVTVNGRERFYDLTMGRAATVEIVDGEVRCAVRSRFEM